jgi:hypothetical protein
VYEKAVEMLDKVIKERFNEKMKSEQRPKLTKRISHTLRKIHPPHRECQVTSGSFWKSIMCLRKS